MATDIRGLSVTLAGRRLALTTDWDGEPPRIVAEGWENTFPVALEPEPITFALTVTALRNAPNHRNPFPKFGLRVWWPRHAMGPRVR